MTSPASSGSPRPPRRPKGAGFSVLTGFITLVVGLSLGIARDQRLRRSVLFFVMLGAMGLLFAGAVLFDAWLSARPWLFLFYWGACLWLTLLAILLALYDLLMVRKMAGSERRRLADEMKTEIRRRLRTGDDHHDPDQRKP